MIYHGWKRFINNRLFCFFFENPIFQTFLPAAVGVYYGAMEFFSNKSFFSIHPIVHENILITLFVSSITLALLKSLYEMQNNDSKNKYISYLESMTLLAERAIKHKTCRFLDVAETLDVKKKKTDILKNLAKPKDQINIILEKSEDLFRECIGLDEESHHITIMRKTHDSSKWHYSVTTLTKAEKSKHSAQDIIDNDVAAKLCIENAEQIFITCKKRFAKDGRYLMYGKDMENETGSAYYHSFDVGIGKQFVDKHLIIVSSYGKVLANPDDPRECEMLRFVLKQICLRLKLELSLLSVTKWKYGDN